jgi:hypothetical protein
MGKKFEDKTHPPGYESLGFAVMHKAVEDLRDMQRAGLVRGTTVVKPWPRYLDHAGYMAPRTIAGCNEAKLPDEICAWWNSDTPELLAQLIDMQTPMASIRARIGALR